MREKKLNIKPRLLRDKEQMYKYKLQKRKKKKDLSQNIAFPNNQLKGTTFS